VRATREERLAVEADPPASEVLGIAEGGSRSRVAARDRGWLMRRVLLGADLIALTTAFLLVEFVYLGQQATQDAVSLRAEFLLFFLTLPGWIVLAKLYGLYDLDEERADHSTADEVAKVFHLITVGGFVFYAGASLTGLAHPPTAKIVLFWALAIVLVGMGRALARVAARRHQWYVQNTVIVGAGDVGQMIARKVLQHPDYGINLVGFVDPAPKERQEGLGDLCLVDSPAGLSEFVREQSIDRVIVAFSNESHEATLDLIRTLTGLGVCIDIVPRLFPLMGQSVGVHGIEGLPLIALPRGRMPRSTLLIKRAMDIVVSLVGLIVLAPLGAIIAIKIKLDSPGPVFFRQLRMGAGESTFEILKFRTMDSNADERKHEVAPLNKHARDSDDPRMFKVPDDPRVTSFGRFLRRYSLDELPQLINVLRGEMSLVGPRPLILDEDRHVTDWRRRRLFVKPGMTGIWQVLGRDDISLEEMVELDLRYIAGWSLLNDFRLLLRTLPAIVRVRSAY